MADPVRVREYEVAHISYAGPVVMNITPGAAPLSDTEPANSMAPQLCQMMGVLNHLYLQLVGPVTPRLLGTSLVLSGSGSLGIGGLCSGVGFFLTGIPAGLDVQFGATNRYPHLGRFAFIVSMGPHLLFTEEQFIVYPEQLFIPSIGSYGRILGFYFYLHPGCSGFFTAYQTPLRDSDFGTPYTYDIGVSGSINPLDNTWALQDF